MRRFLRENGLGLAFGVLFIGSLVGQALVGHSDFNNQAAAHQDATISLGRYVVSSSFWVDVMENWQSEYLQFTLFVLLTVWLVQKGSTESKQVGKEGRESDSDQMIGEHAKADSPSWAKLTGGARLWLYSHSLLIAMTTIWLLVWLAQAVTGRIDYNANQLDHHEAALSLWQYIGTSDFWDRTLQNWQSEFLAVGSFGALSIYLRERGSAESKPVGAPHQATGLEG